MAGALGVSAIRDDTGQWQGCTALDHRKIMGAQYENDGIMAGFEISGTNTLQYQVSEGVAVTSRSSSDGRMLAYWPGGLTPAVEANGAANPRQDVIWVKANNKKEFNDATNLVEIGVTMGTPAATPTAPTIPAGATKVGTMLVPASTTNLAAVTKVGDVDYAIPYGASRGLMKVTQEKRSLEIKAAHQTFCKTSVTLPTDRNLRVLLTICASAAGAAGGADNTKVSEIGGYFRLDGKTTGWFWNMPFRGGAWDPQQKEAIITVPKGTHTIDIECWLGYGVTGNVHYNAQWPGILLQIFDAGIAQ